MFDSDQWKRMHSNRSLELSIFHVDRWMTWHQVKKMSSSLLSISAWSTSHYFFEHCSHDSQYLKWLFYLISFHQLLDNTVDVMKTFWYRRSRHVANSSITCSHNSQTLHLNCLITSSIFSSLTNIDMSLIFFIDRLWLLEENCRMSENSAWWLFWSHNVLTSFELRRIEISWLFWLLFEHRIESKDS